MPGELLLAAENMQDAFQGVAQLGQAGYENVKPILIGASTAGAALVALMIKNKGAAGGEGSKNGRVKRVEAGHLGLRERNNKFYESVPVLDEAGQPVLGEDGEPVLRREFFELLTPGLRIAPHPLRKYALIDTLNLSRGTTQTKIMSADKRQFLIDSRFTWGHVKGLDEHGRRIEYRRKDGTEMSVEELVYNAIMAARNQLEVSEVIGSKVGKYVRKYFEGRKDPQSVDSDNVFDYLVDRGHDEWLDLGSEIRSYDLHLASPTDVDHFMNDLDEEKIGKLLTTVRAHLATDDHAVPPFLPGQTPTPSSTTSELLSWS